MKLLVVVVATQLVEFDESTLTDFSVPALREHLLGDLPSFVNDTSTVVNVEVTEVQM